MSPGRQQSFTVGVVPEPDGVLVTPRGDLDLFTADELWDQIERQPRNGVERLVLDLRQLTFMDATALRLMVRARDLAEKEGFEFALIDGVKPVCRIIDMAGLREQFTFTRA